MNTTKRKVGSRLSTTTITLLMILARTDKVRAGIISPSYSYNEPEPEQVNPANTALSISKFTLLGKRDARTLKEYFGEESTFAEGEVTDLIIEGRLVPNSIFFISRDGCVIICRKTEESGFEELHGKALIKEHSILVLKTQAKKG